MGYVGASFVWVRGLRGSNYYVGCLGYVGQNIFYVGHNFYVELRGSLRGSKIFAWVNFWGVVLKESRLAL